MNNKNRLSFRTLTKFIVRTTLTGHKQESKYFFKLSSLKKYIDSISKNLAIQEMIEDRIQKFTKSINPRQFIRKNDQLNLPEIISDLISIEKFLSQRTKNQTETISRLIDEAISKSNISYKNKQLEIYHEFFNNVESNPLTQKQREACISDEFNTLVLAGAGSGKTSVMVARVGYLIKSGLAKPNEILVLAFNSDAAKELRERIKEKLKDIKDIELCHISTFHSLGKKILDEIHPKKLNVAKHSDDPILYNSIIGQIINDCLVDDKFNTAFIEMYNAINFPPPQEEKIKNEDDYSYYIDKKNLRSLNGDKLKGFGELEIANFLFRNGIRYQYEPSYAQVTNITLDFDYHPDFYIEDEGIFLEHFGIDKNGNTRKDINKDKYTKEINKKRELHQKYGTKLIESYHYEFQDGSLISELENKLIEMGVKFKPISKEVLFDAINNLIKNSNFGSSIAEIIKIMRSNNITEEELTKKLNNFFSPYLTHKIKLVLISVLNNYISFLNRKNEYTFDDMISKSSLYVKEGKYSPQWKYILVDEFQDISPQRANLILNIRNSRKEASLFCVGDDWQSINGFSGSELSFTVKFENKIGPHETIMLDKTFRFDNQICDVSSKFVMRNPLQYKKDISTFKQSKEPSIILQAIDNDNYLPKIKEIIKALPQNASVLILDRNKIGFQLKTTDLYEFKGSHNITAMRIHSSKGLEADYVIIIKATSNYDGIPSPIRSNFVIKAISPTFDSYIHSEERRLFYVALTRAKKKCFIITEYNSPSPFIHELIKNQYNIDKKAIEFEKLYNPISCHKCNFDVAKKKSLSGKYYYKCTNEDYCGNIYKSCLICESAIKPLRDYYGCTNSKCINGNTKYICSCCNYGVVSQEISFAGKRIVKCPNEACLNPYQNHCSYCKEIYQDGSSKCRNPGCFRSNWKCPRCSYNIKKASGKYGEFYACSSKYCDWTQSKIIQI